MRRVVILGAAGRDFHNFLTFYRDNLDYLVVAFTATQIPGIEKRRFPAKLAGPRYPKGIAIFPEEKLPELIRRLRVDEVVFSYSDVSHIEVMHKASIVLASGASFVLLGPNDTALQSKRPVIAVCATRTGAGKSPTVRKISKLLRDMGYEVGIVRHPMPYGDLAKQAVQEFSTPEDLEKQGTTIEEREEYEGHISNGFRVYAGVDYRAVLKLAENKSDVILFDGGNNDFAFVKPDLLFVVADARRPGHETTFHPGETNLRMADYVIISKVDAAPKENSRLIASNVREMNPRAKIIRSKLRVYVENTGAIRDKRVLCVEDGPTLTHGGLPTGAAFRVAREFKAGEIVDPRRFALGSLKEVFSKYPHLGPVLPAMGYSKKQMGELERTINRADCDLVLFGTPADLTRFLRIEKRSARVKYELEEVGRPKLKEVLESFTRKLRYTS